jgi:hypothetical protein
MALFHLGGKTPLHAAAPNLTGNRRKIEKGKWQQKKVRTICSAEGSRVRTLRPADGTGLCRSVVRARSPDTAASLCDWRFRCGTMKVD